jgi:hypothetical protein
MVALVELPSPLTAPPTPVGYGSASPPLPAGPRSRPRIRSNSFSEEPLSSARRPNAPLKEWMSVFHQWTRAALSCQFLLLQRLADGLSRSNIIGMSL